MKMARNEIIQGPQVDKSKIMSDYSRIIVYRRSIIYRL